MKAVSSTLGLDDIVRQRGGLLAQPVEDMTLMANTERGKYFGFEAVGTRIWALMAEPTTVADICAVMMDEFEVDRATCERDVLEFLEQLRAEGMIEVERA